MRLSVSNIAWGLENDEAMLSRLADMGFEGVEVAPGRVVAGGEPYAHVAEAADWVEGVRAKYGLCVPSMQSIWYGRTEELFGSDADRETLLDATRGAVDFAASMGCPSLVFGCPRNRRLEGRDPAPGLALLREAGEYAASRGCSIALEANPPMYNTDFMNTTREVFEVLRELSCPGVSVNLDLGAIIANGEGLEGIDVSRVSHVHVSEPGLAPIERRGMHREVAAMLLDAGYDRFVSIEMRSTGSLDDVLRAMDYVSEVFA